MKPAPSFVGFRMFVAFLPGIAILATATAMERICGTTPLVISISLLMTGLFALRFWTLTGQPASFLNRHEMQPAASSDPMSVRMIRTGPESAAELDTRTDTDVCSRATESMYDGGSRTRQILDGLFGFVGLYSLDGTLIDANEAPLRVAGLRREDVLGRPFWETYWWSYDGDVQAALKDALMRAARGEVVRYEPVVRVVNEGRIAIDVTFSPLRNTTGEITHILGFGVDVTDRKRAECLLRQSESRLRTIVESAPECIKLLDADGALLDINPAGLGIIGATSTDRVCGLNALELVDPGYHRLFLDGVAAVFRGETTRQVFEIVGLDGQRHWMDQHAVPIWDTEQPDRVKQMLAVTRDITQQKRAESREAARLNRLKRLSETSLLLTGDPTAVFERVVRLIGELFEVRVVCLSEIVGRELRFRAVCMNGRTFSDMGGCPLEITPCASVEETRDICTFDRVSERFPEATFLRDHHAESYCGLPVLNSEGRVVAVICLLDDKPHEFSGEDHHLLSIIGQRLATEIDQAKVLIDREQILTSLRASEERLNEAQRIAHIGNWELDLATSALFWSPEIFRIFEIDPTTFSASYEGFLDCVHPDDRETVSRVYADSLMTNQPYEIVHRLLMVDGRIKFVQERGEHFHDATGRPLRSIGTVQDITERKRAELALAESEARYKRVERGINEGLWEFDVTTGMAYHSSRCLKMLGYSADDVPTRLGAFLDLIHPDNRADVRAAVEQCIHATRAFDAETRLRRRDGHYLWVRLRGESEHDADGNPSRISGSIGDISDRKQAEQAVIFERNRLRQILDSQYGLVVVLALDGTVIEVNQMSLTGRDRANVLGRRFCEVGWTEPCNEPQIRTAVAAAARGETVRRDIVAHFSGPGRRDMDAVFSPLRDESGLVVNIVVVAVDISDRKQMEVDLRRSLREKEALLKEVHHRVKNNLQVITSLLRLEAGRSVKAETNAVLSDMQNRIRSMAVLHELLYRSGAFDAVDLGTYLRQLATQSFPTLSERPGSIRLRLDLVSHHIVLDQAIPCGMLVNELISNCLKHGFPDGRTGEVGIDLQQVGSGPQLRLRVSDTGIGLPADFEVKRKKSLGLQLVSDLAEQLGGILEIQPGPPAVFSVTFNADKPNRSANPE